MAEPGGAEQDRIRICMRREAPLGGDCLVCLTLSDSRRVGSRRSLSWRKRLMSFIDHRLLLYKIELLLTSRLQQVRSLMNSSV